MSLSLVKSAQLIVTSHPTATIGVVDFCAAGRCCSPRRSIERWSRSLGIELLVGKSVPSMSNVDRLHHGDDSRMRIRASRHCLHRRVVVLDELFKPRLVARRGFPFWPRGRSVSAELPLSPRRQEWWFSLKLLRSYCASVSISWWKE